MKSAMCGPAESFYIFFYVDILLSMEELMQTLSIKSRLEDSILMVKAMQFS